MPQRHKDAESFGIALFLLFELKRAYEKFEFIYHIVI